MDLPIDVVSDGPPPKFRWRQVMQTPVGPRVVDHEGMLPPNLETAVATLVGIARQLERENVTLKTQVSASKASTQATIPTMQGKRKP